MKYNKILIAVDSSPHAIHAAKMGFGLARRLKTIIGLLFVVDRNKEVINADLGITPERSETVLLKQVDETIEHLIKMYHGVEEVLRFTPEGFPQKEIINTAKEWEADLIVMGTHGHSGLTHLLMGSVAEYAIKHAEVPVMVGSSKHTNK